jgi:hypothetical protein
VDRRELLGSPKARGKQSERKKTSTPTPVQYVTS